MNIVVFSITILFTYFFQAQVFASETNTDYLFFEHWRHYDSQGIACEECHTGPNNGVFTLPGHKECETCHSPGKKNDYESATAENCGKCHPEDTSYSTQILSEVERSNRSFFHTKQTHQLCDICHDSMLADTVPMGKLLLSQEERERVRRKAHRFYFVEKCGACHKDNRNHDKKPKGHDENWLTKGHREAAPEFRCRICHTKSTCKKCHEDVY